MTEPSKRSIKFIYIIFLLTWINVLIIRVVNRVPSLARWLYCVGYSRHEMSVKLLCIYKIKINDSRSSLHWQSSYNFFLSCGVLLQYNLWAQSGTQLTILPIIISVFSCITASDKWFLTLQFQSIISFNSGKDFVTTTLLGTFQYQVNLYLYYES